MLVLGDQEALPCFQTSVPTSDPLTLAQSGSPSDSEIWVGAEVAWVCGPLPAYPKAVHQAPDASHIQQYIQYI
jgi:hypothetical protein